MPPHSFSAHALEYAVLTWFLTSEETHSWLQPLCWSSRTAKSPSRIGFPGPASLGLSLPGSFWWFAAELQFTEVFCLGFKTHTHTHIHCVKWSVLCQSWDATQNLMTSSYHVQPCAQNLVSGLTTLRYQLFSWRDTSTQSACLKERSGLCARVGVYTIGEFFVNRLLIPNTGF